MTERTDRASLPELHATDGGYKRCVARISCPKASSHISLVDVAKAGGGDFVSHGDGSAPRVVSEVLEGCFTVSADRGRARTYSEDGEKLTPTQARSWRRRVARANAIETR